MKKVALSVMVFAVISLMLSGACFAVSRGSGGWGMGSPYGRMYDIKTVESVSGEVIKVDTIMPMRGMSNGIHLTLKTASGTVSVHLGPAWYIYKQDISIEPRDKIEVRGSMVMIDGKPALIAAEVKKGDETLTLRDESGFPAWSGWRRR